MIPLLLAGTLAYVLSALSAAYRPDAPLATILAVVGAVLLASLAMASLLGAPLSVHLAFGPPGFAFGLGIWALPALFVLLVSVVGALGAIYGGAYVAHLPGPKRRHVKLLLPLFLCSMTLVPLATDLAAFIVAWEAMSLTSYALVMTDGERPEVVRAGYIYLVLTHFGAACLLAGFLLLANATGSMDFGIWAHLAPNLAPGLRSAVFVLLLLGFGGKAALVPLHVWLPRAHPVAPSHVSGLMSGVMLKIAIYGLVLFGWRVLGPGPLWWGLTVLALGLASSVLGVLYALMEHDLKRLLAYHSVENIGIITMALGVSLLAAHARLPLLAALALVAALYHTVNHALFKTALFLNAGSIQFAGVGRNLDRMGGLLTRLPWTGLSLLLAAASISGLPPFNGFVSEWLTYQSLVRLAAEGGRLLALAGLAGVLGLALTGGLAAACFVKVGGVALLGRARTPAAQRAQEVPAAMYVPAAVLSGLCLGVGLLPALIARPLSLAAAATLGPTATAAATTAGRLTGAVLLTLPWGGAHLGPAAFATVALVIAGAVGLAITVTGGRRSRPAPEVRAPWACGGELPLESQYSATAYAKPFRQIFGLIYRPVRSIHVTSAVHPFFRTHVAYEGEITHVVDRFVYGPALAGLVALARYGRRLQSGSLRLYLGYMLVTLLLLLALVR